MRSRSPERRAAEREPQVDPVLLQDLTSLARAVSGDPEVSVRIGKVWAVDPEKREITAVVKPGSFRQVLLAGICHEAGHLVLSHYLKWLPEPEDDLASGDEHGEARRNALINSLNAIEDLRLENWLPQRLPGCLPWLEALNQSSVRWATDGRLTESLLDAVLFGLGCRYLPGLSDLTLAFPSQVETALETLAAPVEAYIACQPGPVGDTSLGVRDELLRSSGAGLAETVIRSLSLFDCECILQAWRANQLFMEAIWPVLLALLEQDLAAGRTPAAARRPELAAGQAAGPGRPIRLPLPLGDRLEELEELEELLGSFPELPPRETAPPVLPEDGLGRATRRLENVLDQLLQDQTAVRYEEGFATGPRVSLTSAMAAEADPLRYDTMWMRRQRHEPVRPTVLVLIDLSGSMRGEKVQQATLAALMLNDALEAVGISHSLIGFQDKLIPLKPFGSAAGTGIRRLLRQMPMEVHGNRPGGHNRPGHNNDGQCLEAAVELLNGQLNQTKDGRGLLIVISDGLPAPSHGDRDGEIRRLRNCVRRVREDGRMRLVAVGLGPRTEHVSEYYPQSRANLPATELPQALSAILRSDLGGGTMLSA